MAIIFTIQTCLYLYIYEYQDSHLITKKLLFSENKACTSEEFTCKNNIGECIPLAWMCDQNNDCSDGSDEAACSEYYYLLFRMHFGIY